MENRHYLKGNPPGEGFWEMILNYNWPGNIRELITVLKRAGIMLDGPVSGADIDAIIQQGIYKKSFEEKNGRAEIAWEKIKSGESFWDVVWPLFKDREVDRYFVKGILKKSFVLSSNNFKDMLGILNISETDYQKFMSLMYKYKFDPRV
jgi:DNA-binding NtrC family response regulator